jgi:tetratricopeptide (TPR) repeat protein
MYERIIGDCEVIMHNFGNLPLAIAQAGSYMGARRITPQRFLASYRKNRATILDYCPRLLDYKVHVSGDETGRERIISAFTTWELSLCEIDTPGRSNQEEKNPFLKIPATELKPPAQLLLLSAFFDHTGISELLFETAALAANSHCPAWLPSSCVVHGMWDNDKFLDIVQELSSLSLIEKREDDPNDPDGPTVYSLHPLVQEWAKLRLDPDERQAYFLQSIWILADFLDPDSYEETQIQSKTLILQNLDEILKNDDELRAQGLPPLLAVRELIEVALRFASYYLDHGHYKEARSLYKKVIERNQPAKGIDPPKALQLDFLHAEEGIAITDLLEANYDQAAKRCAAVVDGYTRLLGKDSHERLRALRNLAEIHGGQGDYSDVVSLYTEVVTTFERTVGSDHLITLREVEGLGNAYRVNKQYNQAAEHYCRALAGMERLLPPKHPDLLGIVEGLGIVRHGQKRYKDAEQLFTRALEGNEDTIGPDHPDTLNIVEELGNLWAEQGHLDVAKPFYERARHGRCLLLGMNHPDSRRSICYLAELEAALTAAANIPIYHETPFYPWYRSVSDYAEAMEFRKTCDDGSEV